MMNEKIIQLFTDISEILNESEVPPPISFSVLMKLAAINGLHLEMSRSDFLRAADTVYKIESFIVEDVANLPMQ
jgi:hypothetical protein